jgi:hypothetical protein
MISITNNENKGSIWLWLWRIVIIIGSLTTIFIITLFSDRGFDLTDEGFYYLNYLHPFDIPAASTAYHYIGGYIYKILGYNIYLLRISVLVGMVISSSIFCIVFDYMMRKQYKNLNLELPDRVAIGALLVLSNLSIYSIFTTSWSYNHLNLVVMTIVFSIFLGLVMPANNIKMRKIIGLNILCTAFIFFDFFIKFPSSISMFGLLVMLLLLTSNISWRKKGLVGLSIFISIIIFLIGYFTLIQSISESYRNIKEVMAAAALSGGGLNDLWRYGREIRGLIVSIFTHYWIIVVLMVLGNIVLLWRTKYSHNIKWQALGWNGITWLIFLLIAFKEELYKNSVWLTASGNTLRFYVAIILLLGIHLLGSIIVLDKLSSLNWRVFKKWFLVGLLFLAFPLVGAIGTTNLIILNAFINLITLFAICIILLYELSLLWNCLGILRVGMLILSGFICSQIIYGYVVMPYGNGYYPSGVAVPLSNQTTLTTFGFPANTLLLDEPNHNFINQTRSILQNSGFSVGDDIIGLFDMPGLIFAVGGNSLGRPWYFSTPPQMDLDVHFLQTADPERVKTAFLMTKGDQLIAERVLRRAGVEFPEKYLLMETAITPYTKETIYFWKPVIKGKKG